MNTERVTVLVPNEKVSRQVSDTFVRIARLMGAVKSLADAICQQDEEAPDAERIIAIALGTWKTMPGRF